MCESMLVSLLLADNYKHTYAFWLEHSTVTKIEKDTFSLTQKNKKEVLQCLKRSLPAGAPGHTHGPLPADKSHLKKNQTKFLLRII